ncbi:hypothetical protein J7I93_00640 [Bacillus sp. ISL-47]|nr:hypothetical protein [Bacillus sp. ISL-47]MBT2686683.1 hypothetical protein [Bacillus sp. ISL-47]MBT2707075.1 hypothetical protein [Pseudomonas sp. ISL-84]
MEEKKVFISLRNLSIATLIGEGEFDHISSINVLRMPFEKKSLYLAVS